MGIDVSEEPLASLFTVENATSFPEDQNFNNYCWSSVWFVLCFIVPISDDVHCTMEI